ncbi:alpha/beta fold hydrolase [Rudaeicoccus suwonensis]|uniref:Pimeloyl-ACP methyl ester carboxylesterase n=1 Tax=Rudaeicoccus suwonensis TaxID=657409 RepID=A0A561E2X6_9MICO|nr:alpha/beta hydrolase [Rudaeicoccus suwonensis]TWE09964.1 pimeloyl-ACP methyl ester carboxylesterase [Rudaeicoccus suwonensis]
MTIGHVLVGSGPMHVIALHGWFGSAQGWGELPERLDTDRCTFAFLDYRGYGSRQDETGDHSIAEISADAIALADELGWDRYALVGHSMGGSAMMRVFADAPDRVTAMVGVSPVPPTGIPFDDDSWALFDGAAASDDNRAAIIDFTTGNVRPQEWVQQMVRFSVDNSRRDAFGAYLPSWGKTDFHDEVPRVEVPLRIIAGARDPALGPQTCEATWLQMYPGAVMNVIDDAGHYAMYEAPDEFMTHLNDALGIHD